MVLLVFNGLASSVLASQHLQVVHDQATEVQHEIAHVNLTLEYGQHSTLQDCCKHKFGYLEPNYNNPDQSLIK